MNMTSFGFDDFDAKGRAEKEAHFRSRDEHTTYCVHIVQGRMHKDGQFEFARRHSGDAAWKYGPASRWAVFKAANGCRGDFDSIWKNGIRTHQEKS